MAETTTLIPHIVCNNALEAIEFYQKAFGAQPAGVIKAPNGDLLHGAMSINGAMFFLAESNPEWCSKSPRDLGGSPVTLHMMVADCDAVYQQAVEAGCTASMPPQDMFWGDRYGVLTDPYGHTWSIATTIKRLSPEEMQAAASAAFADGGTCAN